MRVSSALVFVKEKLEKKKKILYMLYKNAFLNVNTINDPFFIEAIPEEFDEIKK
jgi:hypothetical protein